MGVKLKVSKRLKPKDESKIKRVIQNGVVFHTDGNMDVNAVATPKKKGKVEHKVKAGKGVKIQKIDKDKKEQSNNSNNKTKDSEILNTLPKELTKPKNNVKNSKKNK